MQFGWLTLAHSPSPEDDALGIEQQLEQAVYAETLGFDGVWLTEHNFTGESVYCDPIPFAGALAMKTSRVRIGFAVIQMALRHPVRLATQLALLDNLTKGRIDVGIGRGSIFNEYEYVGFGLRSDDSRERLAEGLGILRQAWSGKPLDHNGKHYQLSFPELRPRPYQRPHPPIWQSAVSPASFEASGVQGAPVMTTRLTGDVLAGRLKLYEAGLARSGLSAAEQKRLRRDAAVWRHIYVAGSRDEARETLGASLLHTREHMIHVREAFNPADFAMAPEFLNAWTNPKVSHEDGVRFALDTGGAIFGTASDVADQLAELRRVSGVEHVLAQMSFGYLPHDKIMRSMRLFGEAVMPKLR